MKDKAIMIQGTSSSVGKSILCTALCRIFTQDGYDVNPFKSQNMSLNSYITYEGHEMGRAQVIQAEASRKIPTSKMNPILLKPTSDRKSQVIIKGKVYKNMDAVEYFAFKPELRQMISDIFLELQSKSNIVVIEGAGSPAEINLKKDDIVNMGMAKLAKSPVILVGDIDRGGVFASLYGTLMLLSEDERKLVKGVIINKFRGSKEILEPGLRQLEELIDIPVLGVVPYIDFNIEDEDGFDSWLDNNDKNNSDIDIAIIRLPHISNFTDFNALLRFDDISIRFVKTGDKLGKPDIIIIPGTKNTISDLVYLKESGLYDEIKKCNNNGSFVFGICGGFQMLGNKIIDSLGVESDIVHTEGLGLIDAFTEFCDTKTTTLSKGYIKEFDCTVSGYEIHMGQTVLSHDEHSLINVIERNRDLTDDNDGVFLIQKRIFGTYFHGIFDNSKFTRKFLNAVRDAKGLCEISECPTDYIDFKNEQYDKLANIVRQNLDMKKIYSIIEDGIC